MQVENRLVSTDPDSRLSFPIQEGIPVLLVEEAKELKKDVWEKIIKNVKE